MTTSRRTVRRPLAGIRPRYTWRPFELSETTLAANGSIHLDLSNGAGGDSLLTLGILGDYTVRRIRGELGFVSQSALDSHSMASVWWGVTVVSNDALAVGATALPNPRVDSADWMLHGVAYVEENGIEGSTRGRMPNLETKSMRKVNENNQSVVLVIDLDASVAADVNVYAAGRILVSHGRQ